MPTYGDLAIIAGSERALLPGSKRIGPANPNERIQVTLYVRQQGPEAPVERQGQQYPQQRRYLSAGEFNRSYGADPVDLQRVTTFAAAYGLSVVESNAARRSVLLAGPVSAMSRAFGTELAQYDHPSGAYRGRTGPVYIPTPLAGIVEAVFGLDNRRMARSYLRRANAPAAPASIRLDRPAGGFLPTEVARLYNFPQKQQGHGQTVGIVAFNEFEGGYSASALRAYFQEVLHAAPPEIVDVVVHGRGNMPSSSRDERNVSDEVMLDIQVAAGMAPGARLAMYFSECTEQGWVDALTTAVTDSTNSPSVLSISYGYPEDDSGVYWTESALAQVNRAFRAAAARGITVCCASGAAGLRAQAEFPASSPFALACGGTRIKAAHGVIQKETVYSAGGGGVSVVFDSPAWQSGVNLPPSARPGGRKGRGLPDVAALADADNGFVVINIEGSHLQVSGGTSAAAPLWAALIARINEGLGVRVGYFNPLLYERLSGLLHDITEGSFGGYSACRGWDACTGFGSPNGAALLHALRMGHGSTASS